MDAYFRLGIVIISIVFVSWFLIFKHNQKKRENSKEEIIQPPENDFDEVFPLKNIDESIPNPEPGFYIKENTATLDLPEDNQINFGEIKQAGLLEDLVGNSVKNEYEESESQKIHAVQPDFIQILLLLIYQTRMLFCII